jgi:riboflavin synthase alpha subunit
VATLLRQLGLTNYIFQVEEVGQFDAEWSVWVEDQQLQNWLWEADQEEDVVNIDIEVAAQYVAHLLQNPGLIPGWPDNLEEVAESTAS